MNKKVVIKNKFINLALFSSILVVLSKAFEFLYVIPFHSIIGDSGGALYGYAYTVYLMFMSLSVCALSLSISRVVTEYQTLGFYDVKKRVLILGKKIAVVFGIGCFLLINVLAPVIVSLINKGNSWDIVRCIRIVSVSVMVFPLLGVYRGYFEGHRFLDISAFSGVVEKIFRVLVIVLGGYLVFNVFKFTIPKTVMFTLWGILVGIISSYLYLYIKSRKYESRFKEKIRNVNEPLITDKAIIKKICLYAMPFVIIDGFRYLYNFVDICTVVDGLVKHTSFSTLESESISSMLSIWGFVFNTFIFSICVGIVNSLIPNLEQSIIKKEKNESSKKINLAYEMLLFLIIPITVLISFLAKPIWNLFYGTSQFGPSVLTYYIFVALFMSILYLTVSIIRIYKDYKTILISLLVGLVLKILLNTSLITGFYKMGVPAYYGIISASIIGYIASFVIAIIRLSKKFEINYEDLIKHFIDILCGSMLMSGILFLLKFIVPISSNVRIVNLLIILFYGVVGGLVYVIFTYKTGTIRHVFGKNIKK